MCVCDTSQSLVLPVITVEFCELGVNDYYYSYPFHVLVFHHIVFFLLRSAFWCHGLSVVVVRKCDCNVAVGYCCVQQLRTTAKIVVYYVVFLTTVYQMFRLFKPGVGTIEESGSKLVKLQHSIFFRDRYTSIYGRNLKMTFILSVPKWYNWSCDTHGVT